MRRPNSVRRTTTLDTFRFDGPEGPATVVGAGRDLATTAGSVAVELDAARIELGLEPLGNVITGVRGADGFEQLVGTSTAGRLRRLLQDVVPPADRAGLLYRLLDDLPGAVLVGAMPLLRAGVFPLRPRELLVLTDVCRGWADGGSQHVDIAADRVPTPTGPEPTDLEVTADPFAWHATHPAGHEHMRRSRRIDVWRDGSAVVFDAHFRDVFTPVLGTGAGEVIHEYSVAGRADGALVLEALTVAAHALPWQECNDVPASARQLIGTRLGDLESAVRTRLAGTAGCTHLNDTFRGLDAVPALAAVTP